MIILVEYQCARCLCFDSVVFVAKSAVLHVYTVPISTIL